jgi:membrane protein YdbS with pleckstrin-like domain
MPDPNLPAASTPSPPERSSALRLIRVIISETLLVAIVGTLVWGIAWEAGYFWPGLIAAIVIWLTVSPVIEVATVMRYRREGK